MPDPTAALATFARNIELTTGRAIAEWVALIRASPHTKHGEMVAWLKAEHGLSHSHANHLAKAALAITLAVDGDPVAHLFKGDKAALRPLYDAVIAAALACGPDAEIAPKKNNVSLRRAKQFALIPAHHQDPPRPRPDPQGPRTGGAVGSVGQFQRHVHPPGEAGGVGEVGDEVRGWCGRLMRRRGEMRLVQPETLA